MPEGGNIPPANNRVSDATAEERMASALERIADVAEEILAMVQAEAGADEGHEGR